LKADGTTHCSKTKDGNGKPKQNGNHKDLNVDRTTNAEKKTKRNVATE